jgi:hypothetical protein
MLFQVNNNSNYKTKAKQKQIKMSIGFYFQMNPIVDYEELYMVGGMNTCLFKDYSNDLWNETMKSRMERGVSIHPDDVVTEFFAGITDVKNAVSRSTPLGVKIIKEINKVVTNQLQFIIKMFEKQSKNLKKTNHAAVRGGIYAVTCSNNGDIMEQVCSVCGKRQGKLKRCSLCHVTCYCSAECQKKDWKEHKLVCGSKLNIPK